MEPETSGVLQGDSRVSPEESVQAEQPPAAELDRIPPELRPDKDGKYPAITPKLIKAMRGRYFTVKHVLLTNCGHRLDMINEPRHRHCENCWFQWFNTHPQLVETADQFFRTHGKLALEGMRGKHFVKMFTRYMATVIHFMKQEAEAKATQEKANESSGQQQPAGDSPSTQSESGEVAASSTPVVESGQAESN
jgi:hypothetical protein